MPRSIIRFAAALSAFISVAGWPASAAPWQEGDATSLFRDEIVDAPLRIRWKESSLSDETRFAVAVSGLSWRPTWNGKPLIAQKGKPLSYEEGVFRLASFIEARGDRAYKIAFAFALSVVLDPPEGDRSGGWKVAYDYLRGFGADFDKALVGILASPEKLPLLYDYRHAAADVLVYRASPRLMPIYLGLAGAEDRYLRSRAIAGLGLLAYRSGMGREDSIRGLQVEPREMGVSAVQVSMIDEAVRKAAEDRDYRVRAAAALALGLMGDEESEALLRKLVKDKAYIQIATGDKNSVAVSFPVRLQAARALERWSERVNDGSGIYDTRAVGKAVRGGQNITNDAREAKKKVEHSVRFNDAEW